MVQKQINVGVIGLGVGANHAHAVAEQRSCCLSMVCDFSEERLVEAKQKYPKVKTTVDADDVLTNPDIDLVVIASYDDAHHDQVVVALQNGKHVFVEKPLCLHPYEALDIRDTLRLHPELRLSSNLALRTCPRFASVRQAASNGDFGDIFSLEGDYLWGRKSKLTNGWRTQMDFYSIIHGAAVHMIDLLLWITRRKPVEVHAYGNSLSTAGTGLNAHDYSSLNLLFDDGCVGRVSANGGCVHPHFHRLNVFGTRMTFRHEYEGAMWIVAEGNQIRQIPCIEAYPARENRRNGLFSFIETIQGHTMNPLVSEQDVFDTLSVCFAAEQSVQTGRSVPVEYITL